MKRILILFNFLFFLNVCILAQDINLFSTITTKQDILLNGNIIIYKIFPDSSGNIFVSFKLIQQNHTDTSYINNKSRYLTGYQYKIACLDPCGNLQWWINSKQPLKMSVDSKGNLISCSSESIYLKNNQKIENGRDSCLLLKLNQQGEWLWSEKIRFNDRVTDRRGRTIESDLWIDNQDRIFLVSGVPSWKTDFDMHCINKDGQQQWETHFEELQLDEVAVSPQGHTYISGYRRHDYFGPHKGDRKTTLDWQLLHLNQYGELDTIMQRPYDETPCLQQYDTPRDYSYSIFINHIEFDTAGKPIFAHVDGIASRYTYVILEGKKLFLKNGEFVFALFDQQGKLQWSTQKKLNSSIHENQGTPISYLYNRNWIAAAHRNNSWYFCLPRNTKPIQYPESLLLENNMEIWEMDTIGQGQVNWVKPVKLDYKHNTSAPLSLSFINDSTFYLPGMATDTSVCKLIPYAAIHRISIGAAIDTISFSDILFESNSSIVRKLYWQELDQIAELLLCHGTYTIRLSGYSDNKGTDDANMLFSEKRAFSIKEYLMNKGIDEERINTNAFGKNNPVDTNDTETGRKNNRRVSIQINYH